MRYRPGGSDASQPNIELMVALDCARVLRFVALISSPNSPKRLRCAVCRGLPFRPRIFPLINRVGSAVGSGVGIAVGSGDGSAGAGSIPGSVGAGCGVWPGGEGSSLS